MLNPAKVATGRKILFSVKFFIGDLIIGVFVN